jgi:hypothetical protein
MANELEHVGVLGMHWGRRKSPQQIADHNAKLLTKKQNNWDKKAANPKNKIKAYNLAADYANNVLIPTINKKYGKYDWSNIKYDPSNPYNATGDPKLVKSYKKYMNEYQSSFMKIYDKKMSELIGERPK